ncbi:xanthine dehydrogenase family protein molybdopterin-binding subunit [Burkholderia plantarii]|uniref:xanthine dehydrogenase family protein molybdopterin-binding subunit n=1 Tax=Burkholderia plantarii TaxID=41899 RepID=UPI0008708B9B|nr:molybdopterin cofactor-binding domain-containing protein [Burkholderia plantarii]
MKPLATPASAARRRFLTEGALVVGFTLAPALRAVAQKTTTEAGSFTASAPTLPGSLKLAPLLDAWIRIDEHGITVCTGKVELGTGIRTAMIQLAAEQLRVGVDAVTLVTADTRLTPNEGYTAGSHSIADSGTAIFNAAAQARELLVEAAAHKLGVAPAELRAGDGKVVANDGRALSYAEVVRDVNLHRNAAARTDLGAPSAWRVVGQPVPRVDIPGKVSGGPSYVQDLRLPGMVHARVVRPPAYGASLISADLDAVRAMPGVIAVVRDGSYLAVVARDEWEAIQAMRALSASAQWRPGPALPDQATVHDLLMTFPAEDIAVAGRAAPAGAAVTTRSARYRKPYLSHGSIGPSCAVAHLDGDTLTVWTHTQGVFPLRAGLAEMLSMPPERIHCIHVEGAGCYGHNGADDAAADAALIARAVPGRPVRVQWMREQEHGWEPFGPAMTTRVSAGLDASGRIVGWHYELWSNGHNNRVENAGRLMPAWLLAQPFTPKPQKEIPMPEGGADRNSVPLYTIPNLVVTDHFIQTAPIRVSAMRGLGAYMNVFSTESFIDELAHAAHADPVAFRLAHLGDARAIDVIRLTAARFDWPRRPAGGRGHGTGFAFAQYKNLMAYLAIAVELTVDADTGEVALGRVVASVDCGQVVNPDGVKNQIEGGIVQSASWTLFERTTFDTRRVTSFDWSTYPILRFGSLPRSVEVHLIDRPAMPFLGVGEAAQGPTAAAIANAIFDAIGKRIRETPLLPEKLRG